MITEVLKTSHPSAINHAADVLQHGGLVAFPTDTVYGLGAMPFTDETVEGLFSAKGRSNSRAIAILIGNYDDLNLIVEEFSQKAQVLAQRFWPGPLTLVVNKLSSLPEALSPDGTIGVRMPDHPVALSLLRKTGPLAVSSANLSGQENAITADEVYTQLKGRVHLILDGGKTLGGIPSTVVDCNSPALTILRKGPITMEMIRAAVG